MPTIHPAIQPVSIRGRLSLIGISLMLFISCQPKAAYPDAVAAWSFADSSDESGVNSVLQSHGRIRWEALPAGGKGIYLDGHSWLDAGQGANGELNITGKGLTMYIRMKADSITGYHPLLVKPGTDQNIAYSVALHKIDADTYIEAIMGSDDIGGAHLLKYKLSGEELLQWHDILFRFNGKISELIVDGILRDNEVTVGETRDWNTQPVTIGAQYRQPYGVGDSAKQTIEAAFIGWIDGIALWNSFLPDERVAALSGLKAIKTDGLPTYYAEKYRPQFHFTAKKNWLNDPNGLVYYNGVYHLFFQYMPPHRYGAYKDWGHAISKDLVHWEQIPQHITPHKVWGGCWSGSALVDEQNVSGFQKGKEKPILAFLTNGGNPDAGVGPKCTQCIAYSTDGGNTFTYYDQNPVINNINGANRDPKVVWDPQSRQWILSLYMDKDNDFGLFGSKNLKDWTYLSTVSLKGVAECPGFLPLPVDGDSTKIKWLLYGANGNYVVGSFNGKNFTAETGVQIADYGKNFYAAQTWSNTPDGKCIHIAWMPTKPYPGMPFEQQMNFPTELTLRSTPAGIRMFRLPVQQISALYDQEIKWEKVVTRESANPLQNLNSDLYDLDLELDVRQAKSFSIQLRGATIAYDAAKHLLSCGGNVIENANKGNLINNLGEASLLPENGKIQLRILVDRTTIEIYGNRGAVVLSSCFLPEEAKSYSLHVGGELPVTAVIHSLKSAWPLQAAK